MNYEQKAMNYENKNKAKTNPIKPICTMAGLLIKYKLWLSILYFSNLVVGVWS